MATTLRSGLRAPKSRPVSMPGHRHSSSRGICYSPSLRLAPASLRTRLRSLSLAARDETLPAADADGPAIPSLSVGRAYGCGTIGYLLLCIWHIVKLIERGDKIAMFFDVKRDERIARERRTTVAGRERKRDKGEKAAGERRSNSEADGKKKRARGREREGIARMQGGEERRTLSGAASSPRRCL